jgi:hypothetical protein
MGIKLGNDYLLWIVPSGTGATPLVIKGQGDLSIKRTAATIDTGSKTSGGYATKGAGLRDGSATLKNNVELPDPGFAALETAAKANPPVPFTIQVRKGGEAATDDDVTFECSVYATDFNDDYSKNGVVAVDSTFVFAEAPTVDEMA